MVSSTDRTFTLTKSTAAAADPRLTWTVKASTDLTNWSATTDLADGPAHSGNVIQRQYTGSASRCFFTLEVVLAP